MFLRKILSLILSICLVAYSPFGFSEAFADDSVETPVQVGPVQSVPPVTLKYNSFQTFQAPSLYPQTPLSYGLGEHASTNFAPGVSTIPKSESWFSYTSLQNYMYDFKDMALGWGNYFRSGVQSCPANLNDPASSLYNFDQLLKKTSNVCIKKLETGGNLKPNGEQVQNYCSCIKEKTNDPNEFGFQKMSEGDLKKYEAHYADKVSKDFHENSSDVVKENINNYIDIAAVQMAIQDNPILKEFGDNLVAKEYGDGKTLSDAFQCSAGSLGKYLDSIENKGENGNECTKKGQNKIKNHLIGLAGECVQGGPDCVKKTSLPVLSEAELNGLTFDKLIGAVGFEKEAIRRGLGSDMGRVLETTISDIQGGGGEGFIRPAGSANPIITGFGQQFNLELQTRMTAAELSRQAAMGARGGNPIRTAELLGLGDIAASRVISFVSGGVHEAAHRGQVLSSSDAYGSLLRVNGDYVGMIERVNGGQTQHQEVENAILKQNGDLDIEIFDRKKKIGADFLKDRNEISEYFEHKYQDIANEKSDWHSKAELSENEKKIYASVKNNPAFGLVFGGLKAEPNPSDFRKIMSKLKTKVDKMVAGRQPGSESNFDVFSFASDAFIYIALDSGLEAMNGCNKVKEDLSIMCVLGSKEKVPIDASYASAEIANLASLTAENSSDFPGTEAEYDQYIKSKSQLNCFYVLNNLNKNNESKCSENREALFSRNAVDNLLRGDSEVFSGIGGNSCGVPSQALAIRDENGNGVTADGFKDSMIDTNRAGSINVDMANSRTRRTKGKTPSEQAMSNIVNSIGTSSMGGKIAKMGPIRKKSVFNDLAAQQNANGQVAEKEQSNAFKSMFSNLFSDDKSSDSSNNLTAGSIINGKGSIKENLGSNASLVDPDLLARLEEMERRLAEREGELSNKESEVRAKGENPEINPTIAKLREDIKNLKSQLTDQAVVAVNQVEKKKTQRAQNANFANSPFTNTFSGGATKSSQDSVNQAANSGVSSNGSVSNFSGGGGSFAKRGPASIGGVDESSSFQGIALTQSFEVSNFDDNTVSAILPSKGNVGQSFRLVSPDGRSVVYKIIGKNSDGTLKFEKVDTEAAFVAHLNEQFSEIEESTGPFIPDTKMAEMEAYKAQRAEWEKAKSLMDQAIDKK